MAIKAIIFDLGGVIVELDFSKFYEEIISPSPLNKPQAPLMLKFFRQSDIYHQGNMSDEEFYHLACNILQTDKCILDEERFFKAFNSIISGKNDEIIEILKKIKENYKLMCISNINSSHWEYLQQKNWEFIEYFDELILSHEIHMTKPNPEIYQYTIEKADCNPNEILFIDDGLNNVQAAEKFGIIGIKYQNPKQLIRELSNFGVKVE
ncbi:MAG: HAD-IA family hydrolase [Candidatus Lokiarchaeota archaeon]|nr:HAD-IA family hydrolase [Candidatus Lokiarchaeota archaeon]MBD3198788.1 HAD-IA family hydrolase [Candidatus Lokiarchaeota archaeon]